MIQVGVPLEDKNKTGATPLHVSCLQGYIEASKLLVEACKKIFQIVVVVVGFSFFF